MRISIGVLAWNEAASIERTVRSILTQSLFTHTPASVERVQVVCVPNGCTDHTAQVARDALEKHRPHAGNVALLVSEVDRPSKINAWNEFVHRFSDQAADFLILMDADVVLGHPDTLANLVQQLRVTPDAFVSVGRVLKSIALKPKLTIWERVSLLATEARWEGRDYAGLAGCLYCGRGEVLRRIWMPEGMIGEDAFLNGILVRDFLTSQLPNRNRVVLAPDASVYFDAYLHPWHIWCNQRRRAVIRGVDAILYDFLWANVTASEDAADILRRKQHEDPRWFEKLLARRLDETGWWVLPKGVMSQRWRQFCKLSLRRRLVTAPAVAVGIILDLLTHLAANRILKRRRFRGVWKDKASRPEAALHASG